MRLVALHTIHAAFCVQQAQPAVAPQPAVGDRPAVPGQAEVKAKYRRDAILPRLVDPKTNVIVRDGTFDPADYGISDDEVKAPIKAGSVRVLTREVPVDDEADATDPQPEDPADPDAGTATPVRTRYGRRQTS